MKNKQFGFTLLEMLVVLGIIGVIMTIITSSFSTAQKKARDTKRKTDINTIQKAVEQYYSVCGYKYPTPINTPDIGSVYCEDPSTVIMTLAPKDPKTDDPYVYTAPDDGVSYSLCIPTREAARVFESEESVSTFCVSNQQ
ncbi:hypothetical protein COY87_01960 [Candidatus Roizmanbacteria bacterium CG_4_10_14_0_8_um_filter_33_9]|uniref:Type II secretion system protein GspG C-terminal domain-containing protein n=1 Tax=Candidatus Roizmanbacteria bacterium CG_4_10_14_0_8_um_filter_33_9 TaxID=1974826 RepID=A0A2M7QIY3_9BACT|nr:MAG: hypothetical protein COY87_01960 [Candidatus Roizmanbacteria bacterium CG_4_10_14_0_8_um_filter_33_9]